MLFASCSLLAGRCFPGCSLLLVLLEDFTLDSGLAQRNVLHVDEAASHLMEQQHMELADLPTVDMACTRGQPVFKSVFQGLEGWVQDAGGGLARSCCPGMHFAVKWMRC
jgi:hypothetical protein